MLLPTDLKDLDVRQRLVLHNNLLRCSRRKHMQHKKKLYYRQAAEANLKKLLTMADPTQLPIVEEQLRAVQRIIRDTSSSN